MPRSQTSDLIVPAANLLTIGAKAKGKLTDLDFKIANHLDSPIADPTLSTLRKAFSLAYPENRLQEGDSAAVATICDLCINALLPLGTALRALRLSPIEDLEDGHKPESQIYKFVFCHREVLERLLDGDSKRQGLLEILDCVPADDLIHCLHRVLLMAVDGLTDNCDPFDVLVDVRQLVAPTLAPFNDLLDAIDVEPIAVPPRRRIVAFSELKDDQN